MAKEKSAARPGARKALARGIAKRKPSKRKAPGTTRTAAATTRTAAAVSPQSDLCNDMAVEDQLISSSLSLHELFQQQTRQILDRTDLGEDQKQHILVAMSCPCCGAGAMSYTAKLKR
jgi:hypothetical protein